MKKLLLLLIIGLLVAPSVGWRLDPERRAEVVIIDQSVIRQGEEGHAHLIWLLHQMRIRTRQGTEYRLGDHYGYFPGEPNPVRRFDFSMIGGADLVYVADTRGVWRSSLETIEIMRDRQRDELLHSGLTLQEITALETYAAGGGTLVAEALLFFARHEEPDVALRRLENLFGVRWTGWLGRWFPNMGHVEHVPFWVRGLYERSMNQSWPFRGPGLLLLHPATGRFQVLTEGVELRAPGPEMVISQRRGALEQGVRSGIPVSGWFEITEAHSPETIWAIMRLPVTPLGAQTLEQHGIPPLFPLAVVQHGAGATWYLAAETGPAFSWLGPSQMKWAPRIRGALAPFLESHLPGETALWHFFVPLWHNLLDPLAR